MRDFLFQLAGWSILIVLGLVAGVALALAAFTLGWLSTLLPVAY
nr:MAG TPA: hypothetical protein [Caudoviricetes sp.]